VMRRTTGSILPDIDVIGRTLPVDFGDWCRPWPAAR
jgi:hypothetical protein